MRTKQVIDDVATGLAGLALPTHRVIRYYRPLSLSGPTGALVPALSIAPAKLTPELEETVNVQNDAYSWEDSLMITWYAGQLSAMSVGVADEALAGATLGHVELITDLLATWAAGIPGASYQSEVTLSDVHFGPIEGGIYASEINVKIRTWEN